MFPIKVIALFVPDRLVGHLQHVLSAEGEVIAAGTWHELDQIIRKHPVEVVVADPAADGSLSPDEITRLLQQFPSLPVIAYVAVAPAQMRAILELSKAGLKHVVFQRFEDSNPRFSRLIGMVRGDPTSEKMLRELAPYLSQLPVRLAGAVEEMFESPSRFVTVLDMAGAAGIPGVKLYRSFEIAGFGSPKKLLIAAKLLRASVYLRDPGYAIVDVAAKVGYSYSRKFAQHCVAVFGMNPARVRKRVSEEEAVRLITKWVLANLKTDNHSAVSMKENIDSY